MKNGLKLLALLLFTNSFTLHGMQKSSQGFGETAIACVVTAALSAGIALGFGIGYFLAQKAYQKTCESWDGYWKDYYAAREVRADGWTNLMEAARDSDLQRAEKLLKNGADVNAQLAQGHTPLLLVAGNKQVKMVELLLRYKANPNLKAQGFTVLGYESAFRNPEIIRLLIDAGVEVNAPANSNTGATALSFASSHGCFDTVQVFVEYGHADVNKCDNTGKSSLMWACQNGYTNIAKYLLQNGADVDAMDNAGNSALQYAEDNKHYPIRQMLVKKYGANFSKTTTFARDIIKNEDRPVGLCHTPNYTFTLEDHGLDFAEQSIDDSLIGQGSFDDKKFSLINAASNGDAQRINDYIAQGIEVNAQDQNGKTALITAAIGNHVEIVQNLLAAKADSNAHDALLETALGYAANKGYTAIVQMLIQAGADTNFASIHGNTPLIYASSNGHLDTVIELTKAKANITHRNNKGMTALDDALAQNHSDIIAHLESQLTIQKQSTSTEKFEIKDDQ